MNRVVSLVINAVYASQGRMCETRIPPFYPSKLRIFMQHSMNSSMAGDRDEMNGNMAKKIYSAFSVPPGV